MSDIQCDIFPNENYPPDTYLCLVSNPPEVLLAPPSLWKRCAASLKKLIHCNADNYHDERVGWPSTPVLKGDNTPDWGDKEIHCTLRTHQSDGSPINLTGAMLHIFLFKYNARQSDEVIGSYAINMEHLLRISAKQGRGINDGEDDTGPWSRSMRFDSNTAPHRQQENVMMSRDIDGPLLRSGMQTAVLRCTMDAWWVDEALAVAGRMSSLEGESYERMERMSYSKGIMGALRARNKQLTKNTL